MTNEEVINDFRRRYLGTYVFLKMENKGIETLVRVDAVEDSSSKVGVLRLSSNEFGTMTLNLGSEDHSLIFKYPPVGVFQHRGDAYLFRRLPARQYSRGICHHNSLMVNVTREFAGNACQWHTTEVQSAFNHKTFALQEAFGMLKTKECRSVALKNNFSISKSLFETPEHVIWFWNKPVARCSNKGVVSTIYEEVLTSQLKELE